MTMLPSLGEDTEKLIQEAIEKLKKAVIDENDEFRRKAALKGLYDALGYIKAR